MKPARLILSAIACEALLLAFGPPPSPSPAGKGKELFAHRCSGCHAPDINKEGPRLRGVYGRKAAIVPEFGYSEALKKIEIRWDSETLDRWLADPEALAPDNDMSFRLKDAEERTAVVAYLKSLR